MSPAFWKSTPLLAPKDGAESMHFDKSTPAGRTDTAGVTHPFG